MDPITDGVRAHYARPDLLHRIDAALVRLGLDPEAVGPDDLKAVDEFHTGGLAATDALLGQLELGRNTEVIDVGCGIGGTARHMARRFGCSVLGVDLTPGYVATGRVLTERVGLSHRVSLREGSALDLPAENASADLVTMFHVGMNLSDKGRLMQEVARVLRAGGQFALFDVMRGEGAGDLLFPLPWAEAPSVSFVEGPEIYRDAAAEAGLTVVAERDRAAFALDYFAAVFRAVEANGTPPLGIHLLMGDTAGQKLRNYVANVEAGRLAPREIILRR